MQLRKVLGIPESQSDMCTWPEPKPPRCVHISRQWRAVAAAAGTRVGCTVAGGRRAAGGPLLCAHVLPIRQPQTRLPFSPCATLHSSSRRRDVVKSGTGKDLHRRIVDAALGGAKKLKVGQHLKRAVLVAIVGGYGAALRPEPSRSKPVGG